MQIGLGSQASCRGGTRVVAMEASSSGKSQRMPLQETPRYLSILTAAVVLVLQLQNNRIT